MAGEKGKVRQVHAVRTNKIASRYLPNKPRIIGFLTNIPYGRKVPFGESTFGLHLLGRLAFPVGTGGQAAGLGVPKGIFNSARNLSAQKSASVFEARNIAG